MKKKFRIVTIVGTRPEIIRLSSIIKKFEIYFEHYLIHTGQNYDFELNEIFFKDLNLKKPYLYLNCDGDDAVTTIGKILIETNKSLKSLKPDAVIILGDTNSCLSALSAKKLKIPIFHLEAGNRCFDQRVPEEINRKIVDHISDINLTYSSLSREYLISEGFDQDRVIKVGSPMKEVISDNLKNIKKSKILSKLKITKNKFFLVSFHREENIETSNLDDFLTSLNEIIIKYNLPIIFSTHPRTKSKLVQSKIKINKKISIIKPLSFSDYIKLQLNALCVLSDSGTISEESSILDLTAINLRNSHERPEAMEEGTVPMTGCDKKNILRTIDILIEQKNNDYKNKIVNDYNDENVSDKIVRIIVSYIDFINKNLWKKNQKS